MARMNPKAPNCFLAFISKFSRVAYTELKSAGATIIFIVANRNAIIEAQRSNRQIEAQAEAPVIVEMVQVPVIVGATLNIANIVKRGESDSYAALFVLLKN